MQTIQLQVKDDYVSNVVSVLQNLKDVMIESIEVQKDKNLEIDPYFYERREELQQLRADIDSGNMKMYSQKEYDEDMDIFMKELENKYANH
jgi:hypothetical protein